MISSSKGADIGVGTFFDATRITLIEAVGNGNVGTAKSSLEYIVVVVNIILALEAVPAFVLVLVGANIIALSIFTTKGSTLDLEALSAANVATIGAFCILVARVRRTRCNIE